MEPVKSMPSQENMEYSGLASWPPILMWPYFLEQASQISRTMHRKGIIWANQVYSMPNTVWRKVMKLDSRSGATKDMAAITSEMPPAMIKTGVRCL